MAAATPILGPENDTQKKPASEPSGLFFESRRPFLLAAAVRIRGALRLDAFASLLLRQLGVPVSGVIFRPKNLGQQ